MPEISARQPHDAFGSYRAILVAGSLCVALTSAACTMAEGSAEMQVTPNAVAPQMVAIPYLLPGAEVSRFQETENHQTIVGVSEDVQRAIRNATRLVGTDTTYLMVVAARESSFNPRKHANRTSAAGLYQFTADTWLRVIHAFGSKHGLDGYARQITIDQYGTVSMRNWALRNKLLALRRDPRLSALMAAELAQDNEARLERMLRRPVAPAEVYMAHLLGVTHAASVIRAAQLSPQTTGVRLLPSAARANPGVFKPRGRVASARTIVRNIRVLYEREELRFSAGAPWQEG